MKLPGSSRLPAGRGVLTSPGSADATVTGASGHARGILMVVVFYYFYFPR